MTLNSNSSLTDSLDSQSTEDSLIAKQLYQHFENQPKSIVVESEKDTSDSFVDLTEEAQQEELNSVIKLNFPLNESFHNTLRVDKSSDQAMHADLLKTSFMINRKKIDHDFILRLCGQYNHLILSYDHSLFAMQIFTDVFKHVGAKIPNDLILKELVTNCNPAGYGGSFHRQLHNTFIEQRLVLRDTEGSINIECNDSNCVSIKYNPLIPICHFDSMEEKICELSCSLEFTLESQNGEIEYTNGKVELIIPKKLTNYSNNVNILIDKIKEHFLDKGKFMAFGNAGSKESSFVMVPENLAFSKIIDVLDKAMKGDYEELDEIIKSPQSYENIHVNGLNSENFRNFCSQQFNLKLEADSKHQHIFGNILSRYKFNADNFNYDHSVTELILLAIATNDKLTPRYRDALFNQENFRLLPLIVGGKKYIEIFIEEFNDIYLSSLSSTKLTDKVIQLDEFNKIGFFSIIALRQEQNLLDAVLVQYMIRDLAQALEAGEQNPVYGILETSSLVKNEEFIMRVLGALEKDVSNQTKQDLLKNSFITLLATAISQEHATIVEYLCKKCTESANLTIKEICGEALADDKIIEQIEKQIIKNIHSAEKERKERKQKIYDECLKAAAHVGNTGFITKVLSLTKDDPQFTSNKDKQACFQNILTTVLNKTENSSVIERLLEKYSENIISELESNKIEEHAVLNILNGAVKLVEEAIGAKDVKALSIYIAIVEAGVINMQSEENLSIVNKIQKVVNKFAEKQGEAWSCYPAMPVMQDAYAAAKKYIEGYISQEDYNTLKDLTSKLKCLESKLADHARICNLSRRDGANGSSSDISGDEVAENKGNLTIEENNGNINNEVPVNGFLSNSNNFKELKMKTAKKNGKNSLQDKLFYAIERINLQGVERLIKKEGITQSMMSEACKKAKKVETRNKKAKEEMCNILEAKLRELRAQGSKYVSASTSGQTPPISDDNNQILIKATECLNGLVDQVINQGQDSGQSVVEKETEDIGDNFCEALEEQPNAAKTGPTTVVEKVYNSESPVIEDVDEEDPLEKVPGAPVSGLEYKPQDPQESLVNFVETIPKTLATGSVPVVKDGIAKEADKLLNKQEQPSNQPEPASELSYEEERLKFYNNPAFLNIKRQDSFDFGRSSTLVGGGAGSAVDKKASSAASKVPIDDKQPDASKKNAGSYKLAASLLLGGGVGCVILALGLCYACEISVLTAGIIAGVGAPLFLIAAAVVYSCRPKTSFVDNGVQQVAPAGQAVSSFS